MGALLAQLEKEQGNLSVYHDKQAKATGQIADLEKQLADAQEKLVQREAARQNAMGDKKLLEQEVVAIKKDIDDINVAIQKLEQELAQALERERRLLEAQVKDMQARVDEAHTNALKGGKKAMTRMDTRIRELESELDAENRRNADSLKNLRKSERKIKELTYSQDEDKKNHERMQGLIDQLQGKIKSYKKQIEEAEEIAALNLAKYRQVQGNLAGAQEP